MFSRKLLYYLDRIVLCFILVSAVFFIPGALGASANEACFNGTCHSSSGPTIDRTLYDSNPHKIIKCIECHESSTDPVNDSNHGHFIRQLNGTNITGPMTTQYSSQNFSLCYYCHAEEKIVGLLPGWVPSANHMNTTPIIVSSIGTNFINIDAGGYHNGSDGRGYDIPTNIHWNHLDSFGSANYGNGGKFDSNMDGVRDSYQSCTACHNVHGTNYPKMTKNDLAITYGADSNGTYGYIGSDAYLNPGGDIYCTGCHTRGESFKYYRNEINLFGDCVSCHVNGSTGGVNRTAFSQGVHRDINKTDGIVNNADCGTCHYNRDMIRSNIWQCNDCHTEPGKSAAPTAPIIISHISGDKITNYSCTDCHSKVMVDPGTGIPNVTSHYLKRPTIPSVNYCDYCHGPNANTLFMAKNKTIPEFKHNDPFWNGDATCRTCHTNSSVSADPRANETSSFHDLTTELGDAYNGTTRADCVICHIQKGEDFVSAPDPTHKTTNMNVVNCYGCHGAGLNGTNPQKLHSVAATGGACLACHSREVNTSIFGLHAKINISDDPNPNNVTDSDCMTCHFGAADGTMNMEFNAANYSNTYFCEDCHTSSPMARNPAQYANISNAYRKSTMPPGHGLAECKWCHIAGDPLPRLPPFGLPDNLRYHPGGPRGTAKAQNCVTCHYNTPVDNPFGAPGESHSNVIQSEEDSCKDCHVYAENHDVGKVISGQKPIISDFSIPPSIISGTPAEILATIYDYDYLLEIAAAQYQVTNSAGTIIDWSPMTPKDGVFNYAQEVVNITLDTTNLSGIYTVNIKGMASGPKANPSKPYYPLNGQWSDVSSIQFTVIKQTGDATGTVSGSLGNISGGIVSTNTNIFTTTNSEGFYSLTLPPGTYTLIATKEPEYYPESVIIEVTAFTTVTQDIILTLKPAGTIRGNVSISESKKAF